MSLVLDTNVLGFLVHPKAKVHDPVIQKLVARRKADPSVAVYVPEIADYELRRELILNNLMDSIVRLDQLVQELRYLPISTPAMRKACELWADARRRGQPTASDPELDGDVILAAQALEVEGTVATTNIRHLSRYVPVEDWKS